MLGGVSRISLVAALIACLAFLASTASAAPEQAEFRDAILSPGAARTTQAVAEWGGPTVATDGETVTVYFSDSYPVDPNVAKQWADFMTSLVHGPELQTVKIHLEPLSELQRFNVCGPDAYACYNIPTASIYASPTDPSVDFSAKGVLIHEYGHHIEANRANPPFSSENYGTKRWATYENVCARTAAGALFPGEERDQRKYMLNPGEAFAEAYRVLNEQKLGLMLEPWTTVSTVLAPDATALSLLDEDVTTPWTGNTVTQLTATLTSKAQAKTFVVATPLDGTLMVKAAKPGGAKVTMSVLRNGRSVTARTFSRTSATVSSTVCGVRSYKVRVKLAGTIKKTTKATVGLAVSTP